MNEQVSNLIEFMDMSITKRRQVAKRSGDGLESTDIVASQDLHAMILGLVEWVKWLPGFIRTQYTYQAK